MSRWLSAVSWAAVSSGSIGSLRSADPGGRLVPRRVAPLPRLPLVGPLGHVRTAPGREVLVVPRLTDAVHPDLTVQVERLAPVVVDERVDVVAVAGDQPVE